MPLFKCTCKEKSIEIIATTPTQAANSLLKKIGLQTNKHWLGPIFFGFLRKEIISKLSVNKDSYITENEAFNTGESVASSCNVTTNIAQRSGRLIHWLGILSLGKVMMEPCGHMGLVQRMLCLFGQVMRLDLLSILKENYLKFHAR